jgi:hypothetical protein
MERIEAGTLRQEFVAGRLAQQFGEQTFSTYATRIRRQRADDWQVWHVEFPAHPAGSVDRRHLNHRLSRRPLTLQFPQQAEGTSRRSDPK